MRAPSRLKDAHVCLFSEDQKRGRSSGHPPRAIIKSASWLIQEECPSIRKGGLDARCTFMEKPISRWQLSRLPKTHVQTSNQTCNLQNKAQPNGQRRPGLANAGEDVLRCLNIPDPQEDMPGSCTKWWTVQPWSQLLQVNVGPKKGGCPQNDTPL